MRKINIVLVVLTAFGIGCNTEIDILTPNSETIPIVYGLLDPFDSIHSVRIQRSFLISDREGAKLQDPDSLYFNNVEVWIRGIANDETKWVYPLEKSFIDKDSGAFTGENHHVYQLRDTLPIQVLGSSSRVAGRPDIEKIELNIKIADIDVELIQDAPVFSPVVVYGKPSSKVASVYGVSVTQFHSSTKSMDLEARCNFHEAAFNVHIVEITKDGSYEKSIRWHTSNGFSDGYVLSPERLFNRIMMGLIGSDSVNARVFKSFDVEITLALRNFGDYQANLSPWEGMIEYPISGIENAFGFFFTKTKGELVGIGLDRRSLDSLCYGSKWKHLKFKHW